MKHPRMALAAIAALAPLALTACGVGGLLGRKPDPVALGQEVTATIKNATSVHITGTVIAKEGHVKVDMSLTRSGDFYGRMTQGGVSLVVLGTHGHVYLKVTPSLLTLEHAPASACPVVCGKYLAVSGKRSASMRKAFPWSKIMRIGGEVPALTYVETTTVDNTPVWKVADSTGATAYVTSVGVHYLVRLDHGSQYLEFSQWNTATVPPPPPADKIIKLGQAGS